MKKKLLDISNNIDPFTLEVLKIIKQITTDLKVDFFVIGATARDIIFNLVHGITIQRATNDIDFSVRVRNWDIFSKIIEALRQNNFESTKIIHKFSYKSIPSIDIIPFGKISIDSINIKWPDAEAKEMSIIGFEECFNNAEHVCIQIDPYMEIKIASVTGLIIMKLISWKDGYPTRSRDALDILYILKYFIEAGNYNRLQNEYSDLVNENFDFELSGAIMAGRDIARIASQRTLELLKNILEEEIKDPQNSKLISDMMINASIFSRREEIQNHYTLLLGNLLKGLKEEL